MITGSLRWLRIVTAERITIFLTLARELEESQIIFNGDVQFADQLVRAAIGTALLPPPLAAEAAAALEAERGVRSRTHFRLRTESKDLCARLFFASPKLNRVEYSQPESSTSLETLPEVSTRQSPDHTQELFGSSIASLLSVTVPL